MNATTTKTLEQLQQEARAAAEALAAAQAEEERAKREAKYAEENAKRAAAEKVITDKINTMLVPVYEALVAARPQLGNIDIEARNCGIKIGKGEYSDRDLQISVNREQEADHGRFSSFHARYTGRFILEIGDRYQDLPKCRYPSKQDGTFNVAKIVAKVKERVEWKAAIKARAQAKLKQQLSGEQLAAQVRIENGYEEKESYACPIVSRYGTHYPKGSGRVEWTEYTAPPGRVFLKLGTPAYTPEQVKVMLRALGEIRALEPKKEGS